MTVALNGAGQFRLGLAIPVYRPKPSLEQGSSNKPICSVPVFIVLRIYFNNNINLGINPIPNISRYHTTAIDVTLTQRWCGLGCNWCTFARSMLEFYVICAQLSHKIINVNPKKVLALRPDMQKNSICCFSYILSLLYN